MNSCTKELLMPRLGLDESHGAGVPEFIVTIQGVEQTKELHPDVLAVLGIVFLRGWKVGERLVKCWCKAGGAGGCGWLFGELNGYTCAR